MKPWTWNAAVLDSDMCSSAKLVLLVISSYINQIGQSAHPTIETIAKKASLSKRSVNTYIQWAADNGWLEIRKHGFEGQNWANNEYFPRTPDMQYDVESYCKGDATIAQPSQKKVVQITQRSATIAQPNGKGSANNDKKVVQPLHTNSPCKQSNISIKEKDKKESSHEQLMQAIDDVPNWMPKDAWYGFIEMRRQKKKLGTVRAIKLVINKLEKFYNAGQDIEQILDKSTISGWTDVFEIKEDRRANNVSNASRFDPIAYVNRNKGDMNENVIDI